ncbi:aminotransferase class III-fold pyridoxal phosphate-dependent enzyme [Yeosuana sp. MJ-SS3]|uniref:Aminotransferase class III-fold pyridoxal phosphate-dependent enzyme n=1 Tax=Gilvirhabdus luticola TaxID=3079858 RepID=A0ABU3U425_9FLAO|nr:aminotransferase class III-fold pyridoxal phosphate-dependent enzyme [Yeosuana sp. MJ-SS3]MDU8885101.1 aminotransferase class III-fold pyridoxal phosphate-dependent enzyme [Yeosuana sp. MJ-SS3]
MNYSTIKLTPTQAEKFLIELFGIKGKAYILPGEIDLNFRIRVKNFDCYILKISRPNENEDYLDFQQKLLLHIQESKVNLNTPNVINDLSGNSISETIDNQGNKRYVRLISWIEGRLWSSVNPQLDDLRFSLGKKCGLITKTLQEFKHEQSTREFAWDIAKSLWTKKHLHLFSVDKKQIVSSFQQQFEAFQKSYVLLRKSVIHNDANDNNIIVSENLLQPKVKTLIDFGDAVYSQIINDVAVCCAYAIMHHNDPLEAALPIVRGYHSSLNLLEEELYHLYIAIAMRLVISVTKSEINKIEEPKNEYLLISEKPAWELLKKWHAISPDFAYFSFRAACGFTAHPNEQKFNHWASKQTISFTNLFPTINKKQIHLLDLSVSSSWIGHEKEFNDLDFFQFKINKLQKQVPYKIIAGGYLEPRPIYTSSEYDKIGNLGRESRTIHLGIDFWLPEKSPVHSLYDGVVITAINDSGNKEYGGLVILKHTEDSFEFYTLYGHLTVASATQHHIGDLIKKGDEIGKIGNHPENGNWSPHLHFQVMLSMLNYSIDFPGVAYFNQIDVWKSICPDPNLLFNFKELQHKQKISNEDLISFRKKHLGKSLRLQYKTPIKMVRGVGQYLMDQNGRKYLDTVNNVAHVGHEHYSVVKAGREQMALINTNSRYLHENIYDLAKELIETLPPELNVLHFVNSGSEANELAIRMVKAATGSREIIASEFGYHGNTNICIDISSYKFDGKGGSGVPEHTHIIPLPDSFRGKYRGTNTGEEYANEVKKCLERIKNEGKEVGGFIIEPIISCGGQIELPEGFLAEAYNLIRNAGGICISDEVQTGCGRMGKSFWGFQLHHVVPDIVTIGKPLGNGHPIAAVACTQKVAEKFANGMEYFNTFGGNPVSCAIATEVLRVVKREKLQENALHVGKFIKSELQKLAKEFPIIGDVRGQGLFLGIEFVDTKSNQIVEKTDYLANRMKDYGILMSIDGKDHNVLKIKPPLVFTKDNAIELLLYLKKILNEDFMKI